jgi:hypothetical protein
MLAMLLLFSVSTSALASAMRAQQIEVVAGWNAIWLEVDPVDDRVASTFDPSKIDVVARYFTPATQVRFLQNPAEQPWNEPGWGVWYAPSRGEAFLTSLHAVQGSAAYLVHATNAHTITVTGAVQHRPLRWNANSFNLTGLPVAESPRITFARFFSGAGNRLGNQVYRLVEGTWQKVGNLSAAEIRPGEAYWIYAEGRTNYQGPLEAKYVGAGQLNLAANAGSAGIDLINRGTNTLSVKATVEGGLPLFRAVPDLANLTSKTVRMTGEVDLGSISAGKASELRLEYRPTGEPPGSASGILTLKSSDGCILRLPIRAK